MTVVVVLEYLYHAHHERGFIAAYKANLLPRLRSAPGFRHVQVVSRTRMRDHALILIEFALAEHWERFKREAPPDTFPPAQDFLSEEVLWTMPNTGFPRRAQEQR